MPTDPHGYIFLRRALDAFGRAQMSERWAGTEVAWEGRTITSFDGMSMLRSMRELPLGHPQVEFAEKWLRGGGDDFLKLWFLAAEELRISPCVAIAVEAAERLRSAQEAMTKLFESDRLKSFARPLAGGALVPISPDFWRSELLTSRWSSCQIDLWHPFGRPPGWQPNLHWIFVEQESFASVLSSVEAASRHEEPTPDASLADTAKAAASEGPKSAAARAALSLFARRDLLDMQDKDLMRHVENFCRRKGLPMPRDRTMREMKKKLLLEDEDDQAANLATQFARLAK